MTNTIIPRDTARISVNVNGPRQSGVTFAANVTHELLKNVFNDAIPKFITIEPKIQMLTISERIEKARELQLRSIANNTTEQHLMYLAYTSLRTNLVNIGMLLEISSDVFALDAYPDNIDKTVVLMSSVKPLLAGFSVELEKYVDQIRAATFEYPGLRSTGAVLNMINSCNKHLKNHELISFFRVYKEYFKNIEVDVFDRTCISFYSS